MSTWVLLRGLARESGHWGDFPETLRERLTHARVLTIDLPGTGRLHPLRSPMDIEATAQHCRQQVEALAIEAPFHLLAMSLGAMVATDWAARWPGELAGCVLINTSLRPFSPWYRRLRPTNYAALLGLALAPQASRRREETILRLTSQHLDAKTGAAVVDDWMALRAERPVSRANALRQLLAAARYRAPAQAPAVPLLVLASRRDALVDARCSQRLARQWQADIVEHPSAGHDLALDDGPWLADQVARWTQRKGRS